jgi:hypothetical protein
VKQSAIGGESFKDQVDRWHTDAVSWMNTANAAVANGPDAFDLWMRNGVKRMQTAQEIVGLIGDADFAMTVGHFIETYPTALGVTWKGFVKGVKTVAEDALDTAGGIATKLTWETVKVALMVGGGAVVLLLGVGYALKKGNIHVKTPFVSVGGMDRAAASAMNGLVRRRGRTRPRRRLGRHRRRRRYG